MEVNYTEKPICPKCGSDRIRLKWNVLKVMLEVWCLVCEASWWMYGKDDPEGKGQEEDGPCASD